MYLLSGDKPSKLNFTTKMKIIVLGFPTFSYYNAVKDKELKIIFNTASTFNNIRAFSEYNENKLHGTWMSIVSYSYFSGDSPDGEVDVDHHGPPSVGPHAAIVAGLEQEVVQSLRGLLAQAGAAAVERPDNSQQ